MQSEKKVLVTGGAGYIASWIIRLLLEKGITVHATVRDKSNQKKLQHLLDMHQKYPELLTLFEADLLVQGSFETAIKGCTDVMHTASPFQINIKDPQKELIDPALKGTKNVLNAANNCPSVQRVVLTSSVAAINGDNRDLKTKAIDILDESHWNTSSNLKHQPYSYSKTLAEKEAWKINQAQNRWDLVVINPSFVMGPSLSARTDGQSTQFMLDLLNGKLAMGAPELIFGYVDVRDVAHAHIQAMMVDEASGRHILCENSYSVLQISKVINDVFPDKFKLPKSKLPKFLLYIFGPFVNMSWKSVSSNIGYPLKYNNKKSINHLRVCYTSIEKTMQDHAQQLMDGGLVKN